MCRNDIKVSIIVPVYNAEKYIRELVASLTSQTLREMEFVFVNDGSIDDSLLVLQECACRDKRIVVISTKNQGVSAARNIGLQIVRGQYVGFVDADDFVAENMYEVLLQTAEKNKADIVSCGYYLFKDKNNMQPMLDLTSLDMNRSQATRSVLRNENIGMSVCNKLFTKQCIYGLKFTYASNEDRLFLFKAVRNANKISIIKETLYFYRINTDSSSHSAFGISKMDGLYVSEEMHRIIEIEHPDMIEESYASMIISSYFILLMMYRDNASSLYRAEHEKLKNNIINADFSLIKKYVKPMIYYQLLCIRYCEPFFRHVKRMAIKYKT